MPDPATVRRAQQLKDLHRESRPLVLPTIWDVWSAKTAAGAGFSALTVGSHPLAESRGAKDGEGQSFEEVLNAVRPIIAGVDVPVSVDLEAGYGKSPAELVAGLIEVGGAGLNLEDTVHSEGGRLRTLEEHADYVGAVRAAADDAGVPLVINGRTDVFGHASAAGKDKADVLEEAIARLQALVEVGADTVYPVKIQDDDALIAALVEAISVPVNITAHPANHTLARLRDLGVGRVTFGPLFQAALTSHAETLLAHWR